MNKRDAAAKFTAAAGGGACSKALHDHVILSAINSYGSVVHLSATCRSIMKERYSFGEYKTSGFYSSGGEEYIQAIKGFSRRLRDSKKQLHALIGILRKHEMVPELAEVLREAKTVELDGLSDMSPLLPNLKVFFQAENVHKISIAGGLEDLKNFLNLRHVHLEIPHKVYVEYPDLKQVIDLSSLGDLTTISHIANTASLESLSVQASYVQDASGLSRLTNLHKLAVIVDRGLKKLDVSFLRNMTHLKRLTLCK
jgi:hypothetical protein